MKKKLFFGFLFISILAMAVSFGYLNSNQETYEVKPAKSQIEIVVGKKNPVNLNENTQFGTVRFEGKL